jgi:hypothetical protein
MEEVEDIIEKTIKLQMKFEQNRKLKIPGASRWERESKRIKAQLVVRRGVLLVL